LRNVRPANRAALWVPHPKGSVSPTGEDLFRIEIKVSSRRRVASVVVASARGAGHGVRFVPEQARMRWHSREANWWSRARATRQSFDVSSPGPLRNPSLRISSIATRLAPQRAGRDRLDFGSTTAGLWRLSEDQGATPGPGCRTPFAIYSGKLLVMRRDASARLSVSPLTIGAAIR